MPSAPEFLDRSGKIRLPEVVLQIHAEDLRDTSGDVHAACKIRIDLDRIKENGGNDRQPVLFLIISKHRVHIDAEAVCQNHFLEEAEQHQLDAEADPPVFEAVALEELMPQPVKARDRPLQDVRKE